MPDHAPDAIGSEHDDVPKLWSPSLGGMLGGMLRTLVLIAVVVGSGCAGKASEPVAASPMPLRPVRNPTGACGAPPGNGARPGHAPGHWRYLPDCKAPLAREYYRVFAYSESVASMFPRPDGAPGTAQICASEAPGTPLRELFERYTLCAAEPNVERINAMKTEDALAIGHALHVRMRFEASGGHVTPFPYDDDVLAVCDHKPELAKGVLADRCAHTRDLLRRAAEGPVAEIGREPPDEEGPPLAKALNELYQIPLD